MNTKISHPATAGFLAAAMVFLSVTNDVQAGATALATQPFTSSNAVTALPNVLFVLDDSLSMESDFLPDWAGPYKIGSAVYTPANRFFNAAYNGVAYNPSTRYRPPVMYTNAGALDTTTYPSQTGKSVAEGGDATASAVSPNWRAVKKDGYGIQSTSTANLEGNAFYYTTIPGEYCNSAQLRNCTASATATGSYTFPAKLRWCTTSVKAYGTTASANSYCQASNIADTPTNTANGVTAYTHGRMPGPRSSTITFTASGTVTGITVDAAQILSASATGATTGDVASAVATQINACTLSLPGTTNCTTVGYSATASGSDVIVLAPGTTTSSPVVTGVTATTAAFSSGNVPGVSTLTVITPSVTSYVYPGTAAKSPNRTDCAGTTCTYAEEMTNYANWYAYYRTRMQMMKSAASIAFSGVDDKFRVGYYSINNGTGSDFLNLNAFDPTQKYSWYAKLFNATPTDYTPLRVALSNAGRMYAGKLSTLNGQSVTDPMQYSCQQNFTILSTDGYWNDTSVPKRIDGTTDIGQQDGNLDRPYYDGATQTKTVQQTKMKTEQIGLHTFLVEQKTQQQQTSTSRLTESVVTTTTYPWKEQTTTLRTQTTPLVKSEYRLQKRTYPLTSTTRNLEERTYQIQQTVYPLQRYIRNLTRVETPLEARTYKVRSRTKALTKSEYKVTESTQLLTSNTYRVKVGTSLLSKKVYNVTKGTSLLTKKIFNVTATSYQLQSSTYKVKSSTYQLQGRWKERVGENWIQTDWTNVSSCNTGTVTASTKDFECKYVGPTIATGLSTCTNVAASVAPNYTVANPVTCSYEATPTVADVGTCTVVAQGSGTTITPSVTCGYSATPSALTGQTSCTAKDQTAASTMTGNKVVCSYDSSPTTTATNQSSCTWVVPTTAASSPKTECSYQAETFLTGQTSCTVDGKETNPANGQVWSTATSCAYDATPTTTAGQSSCTWVVPATAASAPRTDCVYEAETFANNQTSCSVNSKETNSANGQVWSTATSCATESTAYATSTNLNTCTWVVPATANSAPKTTCTYQTATPVSGKTSCTADPAESGSADGTVYNKAVTCAYDSTPTNSANQSSCTWYTPAVAASAPKITCSYAGSWSGYNDNLTSCTAQAALTGTPASGTTWNGPATECTYMTTPASTLTNQSSCTWVVPSPSASAPRTDCVYNAGAATTTTVSTCTAVPASSTPGNNGTVWTGPAVTCNYATAVLDATNLSTCTAGTASSGPTYNYYYTCGYGAGVVTNNQNSCVVDPAESGPNYNNGSYTACAYQGTYTLTNSNATSCTPVAQSATYSAPEVRCEYAAGTTSASNLTSCTSQAQSPANASPKVGPEVVCAYSGTASATDLNATSCTANRQTSSPYSGPAVDCVYNGTPVVTNNVTSCTTVPQSSAPNYSGPAVSCAYGTPSGWSNATATCTTQAQSAGPSYVGPARECAYSSPVDTLVGTCTEVPQSGGSPYSQLVAKHCVAGPFDVVTGPVVNTVDSCSTAPTSTGSPIVVSTATTCTYQAPVVTNTPTCLPAAKPLVSPFTTEVTCPVSDTGWQPVAPTCTAAGTPPLLFDATGKIVQCRSTDIQGTAAAPTPVAACTPGTDGTTKVQTECPMLIDVGPTPVETCADEAASSSNSYVKTTCNTTNTSTTVMGCTAQTPSAPLWQTVTCAWAGGGTLNTLADVASYYYLTDLRTPDLNNCVGAVVAPATSGSDICPAGGPGTPDTMNNVPTSGVDNNNKQHMTTFTLGLGASGYMQYSPSYQVDTSGDYTTVKGVSPYTADDGIAVDPANGVCSWQSTGECNWPYPSENEQTTIDDLWHAGVNGHGAYFSATDPVSLANSITSALAGVAAAGGAAAAPSVSTPNLIPGDSYIFRTTYTTSDWTGELARYMMDPFTGVISPVPDWSSQAKLDAKTAASRTIYVYDSSVASTKLKAFTASNFGSNSYFNTPHISTAPSGLTQFLCASTDTCLSSADQSSAAGSALVNYLRGDRTNEGTLLDNTKYYRQRQHVLGDMVNSQAAYVSKPQNNYGDPGYTAFVTAQASRKAMIYIGANDGMLHAFAAKGTAATEALVEAAAEANAKVSVDPLNATLVSAAAAATTAANTAVAADTTIGQESWAYIPSMVMPHLFKLADKKYKDKHRYFVDAPPVVADICVSDCTLATAVWKTILVSGLGHGGRGYFALDITDPDNPKALWEFTNANLGYSFSNPQVVKLQNGTWVVIFASGYNNIPNDDAATGDGVGRLFMLNAATGAQISGVSPISTGEGSVSSPSGLAKIIAQVVNPGTDDRVEAVYGGDLLGNVWRFDVNNTIGAAGYDAQLLATLKDGAGNPQPVTTKPEVGLIQDYKVVFVGTGRYLAASDASDDSQQSFYAIKDPRAAGTTPSTAIFDNPGGTPRVVGTSTAGFVGQVQTETTCDTTVITSGLCTNGQVVRTSTNHAVNFLSDNGWYVDLVGDAERVNVDPALGLGLLVFNTNAPSLLACDVGGQSYSYYLNYLTGGPNYAAGNGDSASNNGIAGIFLANELASAPALIMTKSGKLIVVSGLSGGGMTTQRPGEPVLSDSIRRTSWRELIR